MSQNPAAEIPEKQGLVGYKNPPTWTQFKPGQSGNPGGVKKGTIFVSEAYKRLLSLPLEELIVFQPANAAEVAALRQVQVAMEARADHALNSIREITDRTEGKAPQTIKHEDISEIERLIIRVQERALAQVGLELSRDQAIEQIVAYKPELAGHIK